MNLWAWFRRIFIVSDASERDAFATAITGQNLRRLFPIALFSLIVTLFMLARGVLRLATGTAGGFHSAYMALYAVNSLLMIGILLLCGYYGRNPEKRSAGVGRAISAGAFLAVAWAAAVTVPDILSKQRITVFIVSQLLAGTVFLSPPLVALALQFSVEALLLLGVVCFVPVAARDRGVLIGTAVSGLLAFLASRAQYDGALRQFRACRAIEEKNAGLIAQNRELSELSMTDPLTKLMNRRYFDEIFRREWGNACRTGEALCVAVADVDDFKLYNDAFGHQEGDRCLCKIAGAMRASLRRRNDALARYGGEEFIILVRSAGIEKDFAVLESVREAVVNLSITHKNPAALPVITVSIGGYTIAPTMDDSMPEVLRRADEALYAAKTAGKNRVIVRTAADDPPVDNHFTVC